LSAPAIAVVMDRGLAVDYYKQVPVEVFPGGSVAVKEAVFKKPTAVTTLLEYVAAKKPRSLVLVSHGEGSGISLTLTPKSETALVSPHLGSLVESGGKVTKELAGDLEIPLASLRTLQDLARRVRALKLARVDFRACTIGEFADTLELLRAFFGAGAVSAPKKLDLFARAKPAGPNADPKFWEEWRREHPFARVDGSSPGRVAFEFFGDKTAMLVESKNALRTWLDQFLPGSKYKSGWVYVHGFLSADSVILPGEKAYLDNIGQVP
jgi:hypothetical protein